MMEGRWKEEGWRPFRGITTEGRRVESDKEITTEGRKIRKGTISVEDGLYTGKWHLLGMPFGSGLTAPWSNC